MARHRSPVGIFEAAILLVLAAGALWFAAPIPRARRAAADEKEIYAAIGAVADALEARMAPPRSQPPVRVERLLREDPAAARALAGHEASGRAGVVGVRHYWVSVLLPGRDGVIAAPGEEDPAEAARGFCVLAWPREGASPLLRELAALPEGFMWRRADGVAKASGEPRPPVPNAAFPPPGSGPGRVPDPPPDWTQHKKRR